MSCVAKNELCLLRSCDLDLGRGACGTDAGPCNPCMGMEHDGVAREKARQV